MGKESLEKTAQSLKSYITAMIELKEQGVLTNKKDFTGQIGEWLVATIYDGKRATNNNQKGWDVEAKGRHIQVKTHERLSATMLHFQLLKKSLLNTLMN